MLNINVKRGQNLRDIALQYYGSMEGIDQLLGDNQATLSNILDQNLQPGTILRINPNMVIKAKVSNFYVASNTNVATDTNQGGYVPKPPTTDCEGIGCWIVGEMIIPS